MTTYPIAWVVGWTALLACVALAGSGWCRKASERRGAALAFWGLALVAIAAFRLPILHVPHELHPDESQLISGGFTLRHDPVFWRAIDGHTSGPLNHYALVLPVALGGEHPYLAARAFGLVLIGIVLAALLDFARRVFPTRLTLVALLPVVVFFATATDPEHVHYSSEYLPMAWLTVCLWAAVRYVVGGGLGWLVAVGFGLTALPFTKPQLGPVAVTVFAVTAVLAWRRETPRGWRRAVLPLLGGAAAFLVPFALYATAFGLWRDIKIAYLDANLSWVRAARPQGPNAFLAITARPFHVAGALPWGMAVLSLVVAVIVLRVRGLGQRGGYLAIAGAALLASVAGVLNAGQGSPKYFLLCVPALAILSPLLFAALEEQRATSGRFVALLGLVGFLGAGVGWPLAARLGVSGSSLAHYPFYEPTKEKDIAAAVAEVRRWVRPGDMIATWTAHPEFYVRTRCRQGTRDGETSRQMLPTPEREYFRARYLGDLEKNRPLVLVDGARSYRRGFEIEGFPALADYLARHYRVEKEIAGRRIFVRRDLKPLEAAPRE